MKKLLKALKDAQEWIRFGSIIISASISAVTAIMAGGDFQTGAVIGATTTGLVNVALSSHT